MVNGMTRCLIAGIGLALCSSASLAQVDARGHNLGTTPDTREGRAARAGQVFVAGASNCCVANGGLGCDDAECEALICGADSFCCQTAWDSICADAAIAQCAVCEGGGGGDSNCCIANGGLGCDDADCQALICGFDAFCCATQWDQICADEANQFCEVCEGGGTPDLGACCNSNQGPCDDTAESTCIANGGVFQGVGTTCADGACGGGGEGCPGAGGDCCTANGTPGCDDIECCSAICAADSFCCDTAWDGICASAALAQCNCEVQTCELTCPGGSNCIGDSDGDGDTDSVDLNNVLGSFGCGTDGDCGLGDIDGDGDVDSIDLNIVLGDFGCGTEDGGSQIEAEPCGDDTNGGCNSTPVGGSNCCVANGGLGCDNADCEAIVCGADSFCCATAWDGICAAAAADLCGDLCSNLGFPFEPTECGATICGTAWATGGTRDTDWFSLTVDPGTLVTATLTSQFSGVVFIVDASNCAAPAVLGQTGASNLCVAGLPAQACIEAGGEIVVFVAPANFEGLPCGSGANDYFVTISCEAGCKVPALCPGAGGDCCSANGTVGCDDVECCEAICAADAFCCDTAWDQICADAAVNQCAGCGGGGGSNCCFANGGLGCDDADCEALICGADSFCCQTAWDQICADAASLQCAVCNGGGGDSNCCVANGGLGCDDADCEALICGADSFCCATAWDQICADAAVAQCAVCDGGGGNSNCCVANGGLGCDDADCQALICGFDAFCCATQWDQICADEANKFCAVCDGGGTPDLGACCNSNQGPCDDTAEGTCIANGGTFQGVGTSCDNGDCGGAGSNCCVANGGLGCDDADCQALICGADSFCCQTAWDTICANAAIAQCAVCQ